MELFSLLYLLRELPRPSNIFPADFQNQNSGLRYLPQLRDSPTSDGRYFPYFFVIVKRLKLSITSFLILYHKLCGIWTWLSSAPAFNHRLDTFTPSKVRGCMKSSQNYPMLLHRLLLPWRYPTGWLFQNDWSTEQITVSTITPWRGHNLFCFCFAPVLTILELSFKK